MNSKRSKRHKSAPKKSKNTKDDGAEVFVLPPNLLEKLGIQLGSIQSTHECPTQTYKTDLSEVQTKITSKENNHDSEIVSLNPVRSSPIQNETSILETASLMKESLFLSPTFVPTVANVIAGEVEIANGCKQSEKTATSTIDEFDTEHNLVDSFDIQQIMNSNNENGVIEFAEKILQSHEIQIQKLEAQDKDINKCDSVCSKTRDANLDTTTIPIQDVPVGLPLQKNTYEIEIVPDPQWIQGALPSIKSNVIKRSLNETAISTDTQLYPCMDKQIPEEQALADDIEDCEKITPEDLEIDKSHHDNLLTSEIESFQADFLDSLNYGNDAEALKINMSQSAVTIIKADNTTKNKIQLISQEIVNLKDCKIASPLNIHNLIPVTIDAIISTRKDNKSENLISKHIENFNPLLCNFNQDKSNENSSHTNKNKNLEKFNFNAVITDHNSMDPSDKIQSQEYSKGTNLDSNNEIIIPKHVDTISLLSVNNNTITNIPYNKSEPDSNNTLDIPYTKPEENVTNKPEIQKLQSEIPSNNINITLEEGISLEKQSQTGLISNDASMGNMSKIKLDEEMKRKKKHLPSLVNAKRNKEKANQSINGPSKSKSCVQGVEKPGGDNSVDPMEFSINKVGLKTYQRVKKTNKEMKNYSIVCDTLNVVLNNDIDSHENRVVHFCDGVEDYCLCNDFGHLTNYDENDVYEHIHFWQTESVSCDPEIIFGIYYENTMEFNGNFQCDVTDVEEIREKETTPICWQAISTQKSDNDDDEESSLFSSTDGTETSLIYSQSVIFESKKENQILKHNQERNSISETKVTTEVLEHSTNIDENIKIPSQTKYETENSNLNSGKAVNEFICETNLSKTNTSPLQPSVIEETRFLESNNEKAKEPTKLNFVNAEIKSKNLKNNIISHQIKPYDDEKLMQTVSENNQLEVASPSHPKEQMDQLLQVPLHKSEDDISSYQMSKDSQLEIMDVVNVNKNMSDTNVINKNLIDPQSDTAVQSEAPMDIQELNLTCENGTQVPVKGLKKRESVIKAVSASNMIEVEIQPTVRCGVCTELVAEVDWANHASEKHNSIAWKFGQTMDFDDEQFLGVLARKIKKNGILECSICNFKINHLATFILHIEMCVKAKIAKDVENSKTVKCGVCIIDIPLKDWSKHLIKHNYLAWVDGDPKLDLNDKDMVRMHLQSVCEVLGRLTCKCGARRTQALGFLNHLSICKNQVSDQEFVRCGVCRRISDSKFWNDHIKEHNYLAWKDGELALDMEDDSELQRHLCIVSKQQGGLTCQTCGQKRKSGKKYLQHIRKCKQESLRAVTDSANSSVTSPEFTLNSTLAATVKLELTDNPEIPDMPNNPQTSENVYEGSNPVETTNTPIVCGVCNNNVETTNWITHIEAEHDYLAWKFGEKPVDLENEIEVLQHLKEVISKCKVLVCKKCGLSRKYAKKYMNHIKQCGNVQHANTSSNTTLELNEIVECSRLDSDSSRRESADQARTARRRKRSEIESPSAVTDSKNMSVKSPKVTLNSTLAATIKLESTDNPKIPDKRNKPQTSENVDEGSNPVETTNTSVVCGVCNNNVEVTNWITHIELEHDYLAWKFGEKPLDLENESEVLQHLKEVISKCKVLVCKNCGVGRKYAKNYMNHIEQCDGNVQHANTSSNTTLELNETVECSRLDSDSSRRESADQARTGRRRKRAQIESPNAVTDSANDSVTSPEVTLDSGLAATIKLESTDNPEISDIPNKPQTSENVDEGSNPVETTNTSVVCGVCNNNVEVTNWITHIELEHDYLAWKFGEKPLDLENENEVLQHLKEVILKCKVLVCKSCGVGRKYAKNYMNHIEQCDGNVQHANTSSNTTLELNETVECSRLDSDSSRRESADQARTARRRKRAQIESPSAVTDSANDSVASPEVTLDSGLAATIKLESTDNPEIPDIPNKPQTSENVDEGSNSVETTNTSVVCGVCNNNVEVTNWITHIELEHDYLAWKFGEKPLDLENESEVLQHLKEVISKCKVLVCKKCGVDRKYAKNYMNHIEQCDGNVQHANTSSNTTLELNETVECSRLDSDSSRRESADQARTARRRKRAQISSDFDEEDNVVLSKRRRSVVAQSKSVRCGVCKMDVQENTWYTHIEKEHHYLAWKEGETPLNMEDEKEVWSHLLTVSQILDKLVCYKCNYSRKKPKVFLKHIKNCSGTGEEMTGITDQSAQESISANEYIEFEFRNPDVQTAIGARVKIEKEDKTPVKQKKEAPVKQKKKRKDISESEPVTCAVCKKSVTINIWIQHIKQEHDYLAWIEGKPALNLYDKDAVREHLRAISKKENGLVCNKCEVVMKYPKPFLKHVKTCSGKVHSSDLDISDFNSSNLIKCGVCSKDIESRAWIKHIQVAHNYLAWRADETPIDLDDEDAVKDHLTKLLRSTSHLICAKCGFTRRIAAYYMTHMETCNGVPPAQVFEDKKSLLSKNEGLYECAMCHKNILPKHWKKHAFDEHYNVTWIVGDIPIDLKSPYGADKYLKEYQKHEKLVCKICGESRASLMGFYIHIITCGKTEEQMDLYKEDCTTCGQRYFGVYRSLHMATHRQQEINKLLESEMNDPPESDEESTTVIGRRKAAEKANSVIEIYQKSVSKIDYAYKCDNCSFGTDLKKHFQKHKCDLDADAVSEESEDGETSDDYDENLSDLVEEEEVSTTKKEVPKPSWMPIKMLNCDAYYERLIDTFRHIHLTENRLFSEWLISQYSFVSEDQVKEYMPKLQQSCKVLLNRSWEQFEMFEGKRDNRVHSMFVGGSIKRIRWAPCELDTDVERNFLAVSAHLGEDAPRHNYDELPTHPGLIQIWDVGAFNKNPPKFALGLAHDYGTVWDMDWCPSGARESFDNSGKQKEWSRLGLLAIACSNGSAYILSVPYPDSIKTSSENLFVKLKHVAELRLCSTESDRKRYQATAISWSKKKNHSEIVVAYSDGTIARYDLTNTSPLLKTSEDDVTIYYPYHDERALNGCITGVESFPGHGPAADAVCSSSTVGAALAGGAARLASHLPSADALFTPAWPTAMLTSDEGLLHVTTNELDWHGCGRKLTTLYGAATCGRCGRVLTYAPPLLRVARHFPPWSEPYRRAVASINVVLLSSKRKLLKQTTDELSVKIEPITYEDCVNKYGVEFYILQKFRTSGHVKEPSPERFPLADVTSMAYCTSEKFHDKVAVATYSGHIFIFKPAA